MAWIRIGKLDLQTQHIGGITEIAPDACVAFGASGGEWDEVKLSREEIRALIAAAELAEQRRNARIAQDVQTQMATDCAEWANRATEAQAQLAAAREEGDAARADAERLRGLLQRAEEYMEPPYDDSWSVERLKIACDDFRVVLAEVEAALKGAE